MHKMKFLTLPSTEREREREREKQGGREGERERERAKAYPTSKTCQIIVISYTSY